MSRAKPIQLSTHAVMRALERTELSPGQLLDRIDKNAVAWLPAKMPVGHRHALVYCAVSDTYVVAVLATHNRTLKTILALEQWEATYWKIADIWKTLARHAAMQVLAEGPALTPVLLPSTGAQGRPYGPPAPASSPPAEALDVRLVVKIDSPKGPQYHTLLEKVEVQWVALTGSAPAERRRLLPGFLSKLTQRLVGVNAFAELIRQRLQRQAALVVEADCVLLVFGPVGFPVAFLPQVEVGKYLPAMFARLEHHDEVRRVKKLRKEQKIRDKREELTRPATSESVVMSKNKDLLGVLVQPNAAKKRVL